MSCQLPQSTLRLGLHFAFVYLVPAIEVMIIIIIIKRLKENASVAPALPTNNTTQRNNENAEVANNGAPINVTSEQMLLKQLTKNIRMILLISGGFWGTILPAGLISTVVQSFGGTWAEFDAYVYPIQFHILKMCSYLVSLLSSFVNPLIYYWSRRDLREAFKRQLRLLRQNL